MIHIRLPGDKSLSHRALMLAAVADGRSELTNLSDGADVQSTINCLTACGIEIDQMNEVTVIYGRSGEFRQPSANLNAGNSGTTSRLLAGLLSGRNISGTIVGDPSLSMRPFGRIARPLRQLGAQIDLADNDRLPLSFTSADLGTIDYTPPIASAQIKSSILLAGLSSNGTVTVREPRATRDHTERMLISMGADIVIENGAITIGAGKQWLSPIADALPGDPSSAAFPAALAIMLSGRGLQFEDLLINPSRMGFFEALKRMGANIDWGQDRTFVGDDVGHLSVTSSQLSGINIDEDEIPSLIDELPILALLATQAEGTTNVSGAEELRVKESDRIAAICLNLTRMGANITEHDDGFTIVGPTQLYGADIITYGDHRIAMAFAVADYLANGPVNLDDPACVGVSFPDCFDILSSIAA